MPKHILIGTVLLLSTTTLGIAVAAGEVAFLNRNDHEQRVGNESAHAGPRPTVLASETSERERHADRDGRSRSDEDRDDDEGGEGDVAGQNVPADPNAPIPDNGLFNGKDRPKVEVQ